MDDDWSVAAVPCLLYRSIWIPQSNNQSLNSTGYRNCRIHTDWLFLATISLVSLCLPNFPKYLLLCILVHSPKQNIYIYIAPETWFHWFQVPNHPASLFKKGRKFPLFFRGGNSSAASRQGAKLHTNLELFALNLITDIAEIPYPWRWQACARGRKRDLLKRWMDRLDVSKTHPKVPWNAGKWRWYWNLNLGIFFHGWFRDVEVVFPFPKVEDGLVLCNLPCSNHTRSSLLHCLPRLLLLTHMQHSPQAKHPTEAPKKKSDKWGVKNSTKK